jgi:hypothetical protein
MALPETAGVMCGYPKVIVSILSTGTEFAVC